jgi:hypothetical protein
MHPMETWCLVGVVVLNGAVQKGCHEDERRVVVPLADTLKKRYGRPSPEQVNSMKRMLVPEALLFHLVCAQEMEWGVLLLREVWCNQGRND